MGKREQTKAEIEIICRALKVSKGAGYVSRRDLGDILGLDIEKTKESAKLQTRISAAKKELMVEGEVVINVPSKGYKITEDQKLITAEAIKALGRSVGSFEVHRKLFSRVDEKMLELLNLEDISGHQDWANESRQKLGSRYERLQIFAEKHEIDLTDKPDYVQKEIDSASEAMFDEGSMH